MLIETRVRDEDGGARPYLVWTLPEHCVVISSAAVGGGVGPRRWVINAQVSRGYDRRDLDVHIDELRRHAGLDGNGVGMLTGALVDRATTACVDGVDVTSTVGVTMPEWAAHRSGDSQAGPRRPGTINILVWLPVALSQSALVNAVMTTTEAKTQAMVEAGLAGSGTATDAVCIACPSDGTLEPFAGPRSSWGHRLALAVHATVRDGIANGRHGEHP
jgi:adenosylcobinamide amidohydrolase